MLVLKHIKYLFHFEKKNNKMVASFKSTKVLSLIPVEPGVYQEYVYLKSEV